jgi:hypothetical protein
MSSPKFAKETKVQILNKKLLIKFKRIRYMSDSG